MAVTLTASGTQTCTVTTEHFVSSPNVAGAFAAYFDLSDMAAGDVVELRAYKMAIAGGTARVVDYQRFDGVQPPDAVNIKLGTIPNTLTDANATRFSIKQTFGSSIDAPWAVLNTEDATAPVSATVTSIAANAVNASALAADAVTEIQSGLATAAALAVVDSIVDDILLDTAEIGAAGAGLTAINLPNQTMDIVGNITGNLSGSVGSVTAPVTLHADYDAAKTAASQASVDAVNAKTTNLPSDPADQSLIIAATDAIVTAVGTRASQTSVDDVPTNAELASALGTADDAVLAAIALLSIPTANANADALLDRAAAIETGLTFREAMRLIVAAEAAKLSGAATTTVRIRDIADSKDRIVATVDASGNRTAITRDLT